MPDDQVRSSPRSSARLQIACALRPRRAAGQQGDAEARLSTAACAIVAVVLLGEDLGRRHERHLQAVLHRHERREQRDDRLAGADVALQQPVHRRGPLHVVDDLLRAPSAARRSA